MTKEILNPHDVAAILGLDPSTVRRYWKTFGGVKFGRTYRIKRDVLDAYLGGDHAIQAQNGREVDRSGQEGRGNVVVGTLRDKNGSKGLGKQTAQCPAGTSSNGLW